MPQQPVGRKRKHPDSENNNSQAEDEPGVKGGRRMWNEEDSKRAEEETEKVRVREERKRSRRAKKRKQAEEASNDLEEKAAQADIIIALDMSTSPGMAIVDRSNPKNTRYYLIGFAQTDKQQNSFDRLANDAKTPGRIQTTVQGASAELLICRSPKEGAYQHNTDFYEQITAILMDRIMSVLRPNCRVLAVVEAYAFHIVHSSSITKLAELGGAMRNKLFRAKIPFVEVSPTSIKKWFTGKGSADKPDMWRQFQKVAPQILLAEWLPAALSATKIPSPHQDIVDAFAAAHSLHSQRPRK